VGYLTATLLQIFHRYATERILKIGQHMANILANLGGLFFGHPVCTRALFHIRPNKLHIQRSPRMGQKCFFW